MGETVLTIAIIAVIICEWERWRTLRKMQNLNERYEKLIVGLEEMLDNAR